MYVLESILTMSLKSQQQPINLYQSIYERKTWTTDRSTRSSSGVMRTVSILHAAGRIYTSEEGRCEASNRMTTDHRSQLKKQTRSPRGQPARAVRSSKTSAAITEEKLAAFRELTDRLLTRIAKLQLELQDAKEQVYTKKAELTRQRKSFEKEIQALRRGKQYFEARDNIKRCKTRARSTMGAPESRNPTQSHQLLSPPKWDTFPGVR